MPTNRAVTLVGSSCSLPSSSSAVHVAAAEHPQSARRVDGSSLTGASPVNWSGSLGSRALTAQLVGRGRGASLPQPCHLLQPCAEVASLQLLVGSQGSHRGWQLPHVPPNLLAYGCSLPPQCLRMFSAACSPDYSRHFPPRHFPSRHLRVPKEAAPVSARLDGNGAGWWGQGWPHSLAAPPSWRHGPAKPAPGE